MDLHQGMEEEEGVASSVRGDWEIGERVREVWNWEEKRKGERRLEEEFLRASEVAIEANRRNGGLGAMRVLGSEIEEMWNETRFREGF